MNYLVICEVKEVYNVNNIDCIAPAYFGQVWSGFLVGEKVKRRKNWSISLSKNTQHVKRVLQI